MSNHEAFYLLLSLMMAAIEAPHSHAFDKSTSQKRIRSRLTRYSDAEVVLRTPAEI